MARALSCLRGLDYVDPAVVREIAEPVLAHRVIMKSQGAVERSAASVIAEILAGQRTPK
jgi:MoxR-like ATPase